MSAIEAQPILLNNVTVKLGADTYEEALTTCQLVPTTPKVVFAGLGGNTKTLLGVPSWIANLTFAQDLTSGASLHKLLHTSPPGTPLAMELIAVADGDKVTATIVTEPGAIGGDVNTVPSASVALGVNGQPVRAAVGA